MAEIINTAKKNILTNSLHKIRFGGVAMRVTENPYGKKYDKKIEHIFYFKGFGGIYTITEKKEFKDNKLVRVRHSDNISENAKFILPKTKDGFKTINTYYFMPKEEQANFILVKKEIPKPNTLGKIIVYENEFITFIKDENYNEFFGMEIKEENFSSVSNETFEALINIMEKSGKD